MFKQESERALRERIRSAADDLLALADNNDVFVETAEVVMDGAYCDACGDYSGEIYETINIKYRRRRPRK